MFSGRIIQGVYCEIISHLICLIMASNIIRRYGEWDYLLSEQSVLSGVIVK